MSLAPDIFTMPFIGTFLALAIIMVLILIIMKITDLTGYLKNASLDIVEYALTLVKFAILGVPVVLVFYQALQGMIPNAIDAISMMFVALFLWGVVKIIYDLFKEAI